MKHIKIQFVKRALPKSLLIILTIIFVLAGIFYAYKKLFHHKNIQLIYSYKQALPFLKCDGNALILFDVDDTLIRSYDDGIANGRDIPISFMLRAFFKHPSLIKRSIWEHYYSIMWEHAQRFVIEPLVIEIINKLKANGCTVLALTLMDSGPYGVIHNFAKWRYEILKDFGIEMSQTFSNVSFTTFAPYKNHYPTLYNGILYANQESKGAVLGAFLDYFNVHPSKIIFFDDWIDFLDSVGRECDKRNIPFLGFYYQAKKKLPSVWDSDRALVQLDYLMSHKCWLTDEQADRMCKLNELKELEENPSLLDLKK